MLNQIKTLAALELKNLYGINVFRHTKDKKHRAKSILLIVVWVYLILMVAGYMGGLAYGLTYLGMESVVCAYLFTLASMFIFFFAIFKAGSVIFGKHGYDILCSLPVSQSAIVISRFFRMYVENLIVTAVVVLPGLVVYGILAKMGILFWVLGILAVFVVPFIPLVAATLIGAVITAVSSRMKSKNLVSSLLSVALVIAVMLSTSKLSDMEEADFTQETFINLSNTVSELLGKLYPPAVWLGTAVTEGKVLTFLLCAVGSFLFFGLAMSLISMRFHKICQGLFGTTAKHNYQMQKLKETNVTMSLCKREFKRYFGSSIYVSNTIIGPIMGVLLAGTVLFMDTEALLAELTAVIPLEIDLMRVVPFMVAMVFCMMTTSSVSVSMEGKNWWIVKSLPLHAKEIFDAKILMNLLLIAPFYVVAEMLLMIGLRPNMEEVLFLLAAPAVLIVFACVWGITANLMLPNMNWDNEVTIVKQSASAMVGGMGGALLGFVCTVVVLVLPENVASVVKWGICAVVAVLAFVLYQKNNRKNLQEI